MISLIKELLGLLTAQQRKQIIRLQILIVLMSFSEILAVASIGPFMALVGNKEMLSGDSFLAKLFIKSGISGPYEFIFIFGIFVLIFMAVGSLISILTSWKMAQFSTKVGSELGDRLYQYYIYQPWLFHSTGSSAQLTKQIATEASRVTNQILNPLMQMNAKLVLVIFIVTGLFIFNTKVAIITFITFSVAYILLYKLVRKKLLLNGKRISAMSVLRYKLMAEGFGGIKDVLLLGRQKNFIKKFVSTGDLLASAQGTNQALGQTPRYFMELLAFSAIILFILYLIKTYQGDMGKILPILAIYSLAGFKLLPALQQVYASIAAIKGSIASFEAIKLDLINSIRDIPPTEENGFESDLRETFHPQHSIELRNIYFTYPGKKSPVLKDLNIHIPVNHTIGFVGSSGAGKSTIIDLLLGLIHPQSGHLIVDDQIVTPDKLRAWQNSLGYVPQNIFLADCSIKENIAFGQDEDDIDANKIDHVVNMAHLDDMIKNLPDGVNTRVGERGVQLSGGQKQRIGIARCLYQEASVLIFDEATSALDGVTEKQIMNAIYEFSGKKTIIMIAHRIKTVAKCDIIFLMHDGQVIDSGNYNELLERSSLFRDMAAHA